MKSLGNGTVWFYMLEKESGYCEQSTIAQGLHSESCVHTLMCRSLDSKAAGLLSTALTPLYLWIFLHKLKWGLLGAALSCAISIP